MEMFHEVKAFYLSMFDIDSIHKEIYRHTSQLRRFLLRTSPATVTMQGNSSHTLCITLPKIFLPPFSFFSLPLNFPSKEQFGIRFPIHLV